jgi:hypothetical protein
MALVSRGQASPPGIDTCDRNGCILTGYGPSAVSWGELLACAGYLAPGAVMTWILGGQPTPGKHRSRRARISISGPSTTSTEGFGC